MLKEAVGIAGGALLLPTLGVPVVASGLSGLLVAGAGVLVVNAVMKHVTASKESADGKHDGELEDRLSDPFTPRRKV